MVDFLADASIEAEVLKGVARVECWQVEGHHALPDHLHEAAGLLVWHLVHFPRQVFEQKLSSEGTKTKVLVRVGMGIDSVDLQAAGERGIYVANVPDYGVEEVADSTLSLILNLVGSSSCLLFSHSRAAMATLTSQASRAAAQMRKTHVLANGTKENKIRGKKLGIIGLGKIGRAVAERAKPFGFDIFFYDPYLTDGVDKSMGIGRCDSLEDLLASCDVVSLNCDLNTDNHHLLNTATLSHIPKNKGTALLAAMKDGRIGAAALDVLEEEPYTDGHLNEVPDLLLTPHTAFYSDEGFIEMRTKAALEVKRVLQGGAPRNCVNKQWIKS
ncbi:C-terminal-binding protein family protein [Acanthamoeba castellanii str. Neff]|uniref:C-terminal-binding protein family protein n=1 Tax=Acanthamoeba castellanii (strain ATCC 30010 / Neff) TaxID=1257118 RepID=L8GCI7_ACACF|nr:C-terminal-binding protein family protein [Acanthamoeba castellanii str. Neff]ELR10910.1 C-terminal-binding protein family protein [Acanthamoeba castellanii str. Neff]